MVKKPARIQIGRLRYFDAFDFSPAKASGCDLGSLVLRYAESPKAAAKTRADNATGVLNPPVTIPISNPQLVAKFTKVNPPESHFISLDLDLDLDLDFGSAPVLARAPPP